jgi:hypothetical protein
MDRRTLIAAGLAASAMAATGARAQQPPSSPSDAPAGAAPTSSLPPPGPELKPNYPAAPKAETYQRSEIVNGVSNFMGVAAESAAGAIERIFKDNGDPTAYIAGEEGSAAFIGGVRYGSGLLYMKGKEPMRIYWRGPTVGFDAGANSGRVFMLCYNLQVPEFIFRRFPGVDGSAFLIGGLAVNYQRADGVTLAPIHAGAGLRLGVNVGYLAFSRKRSWIPF